MNTVTYDSRALKIDGKRTLIFSGAIHYPRSTPAMWPELMKRSLQAGLNTIETYVFWNLHEKERGVYDFSGRLDLLRFCKLAQATGLNVILRIGPYVCAETNYGGFPFWLRDVPDIKMRTFNRPYMEEMRRWVHLLCDYLKSMFAPQGGPIILAQLENEYGNIASHYAEPGQRYLRWVVELSEELALNIPLVMCSGSVPGAIETINAFMGHEQLDRHFAERPAQPPLWTENWTGWYDTWGYPHHVRTPENLAYAVARFFAAGGSGVNYYMWHGGTNFGRESMYLQTTSYDFSAPLDEFGQATTKSNHLSQLHGLLREHSDLLLESAHLEPLKLGENQRAYVYDNRTDSLIFLCNDDAENTAVVNYNGISYDLSPLSVLLLVRDRVVMNTARVAPFSVVERKRSPILPTLEPWKGWVEPGCPSEGTHLETVDSPRDQLEYTKDRTDYCWYRTKISIAPEEAGNGRLVLEGIGDWVYVFLDGKRVATTEGPLVEDRGRLDENGYLQSFDLEITSGERELSLLCCALGLIKGDWMVGFQNMGDERKGFWGRASWNGRNLPGPWTIEPGLRGERWSLFADGHDVVSWGAYQEITSGRPLTWWRNYFNRPPEKNPLVIDLNGMNKGLIWLNGRCLGRYWLIPAHSKGVQGPNPTVRDEGIGEPTQRYYHIPQEWLKDTNELTLFDEMGGDPSQVKICALE